MKKRRGEYFFMPGKVFFIFVAYQRLRNIFWLISRSSAHTDLDYVIYTRLLHKQLLVVTRCYPVFSCN